MLHYHIWTIGCQMNKADSQRLSTSLERLGYESTPEIEAADIVVLNSCVVRQSAENRVIGKLHSLRRRKRARPDSVLALMGCMVDSVADELKRRFPHVDLFLKPQTFEDLLQLASERSGITAELPLDPHPPTPPLARLSLSSRAATISAPTASFPTDGGGSRAAHGRR